MSDSKTTLSAFTSTLRYLARHHKYLISRSIETKEEGINTFRHEAYISILVLEQLASDKDVAAYRKMYNQLKNEMLEMPVNGVE